MKMNLTICEDNKVTITRVLKGRITPMRHVSRTHRVNLPCLYDVVQNGGHISIKHINTKQQSASISAKGLTTAEMWNIWLFIIGLFDMRRQKIAKLGTPTSCVAISKRDVRIAMEMQHIVHEESGVPPHNVSQHDIIASNLFIFIGHVHHENIPPPVLSN